MTRYGRLLVVVSAVVLAFVAGCGGSPGAGAPEAEPEPPASSGELTGQTFEDDVKLALRLSEDFWVRQFEVSGSTYRPIEAFVPYRGEGGPECGGQPSVPDNAFYCPVGHFVAYDETWMKSLYDRMGDGSVYLIIPHELGHAVQAQLMSDFQVNQQRELQADCYAGGTLGSLIREGRLGAEPGDEAELMLNLSAAGDPTDAWWEPDAHGTAAQRQEAFASGYNNGVGVC
ncbi:neutral zinc metallopeptidase [Streptosporangium sp. KLBMP 9127]|nr:neutral zinc metallopeptidase [Streptosporangium sp. KLBMP 9127]